MALNNPPIPLRTWRRANCLQAQFTRLSVCHEPPRSRLFHSTPSSSSAGPSPAAQRARRAAARRAKPVSKEKSLFRASVDNASAAEIRAKFNDHAALHWHIAMEENMLPSTLPYHEFARVGLELIQRASTDRPTERSIRSISTDADMVYRIGFVVSKFSSGLLPWVMAACVRAGSKHAIMTAAARYFESSASMDSLDVSILHSVQRFAFTDKDPRAIVLYAMLLSRQEKDADAVKLLRPLLRHLYPSKIALSWDDDMLLRGSMLPPWEVFIHSARAIRDYDAVKEAERIAALEYQDPKALASYAYDRLATNDDFDHYEEYMCRAASAGNGDACFRLANFYYLAALKLHPITLKSLSDPHAKQPEKGKVAAAEEQLSEEFQKMRERITSGQLGLAKRVISFCMTPFIQSPFRGDNLSLAFQWYSLARAHRNNKACLFLAAMMRVFERAAFDNTARNLLDEAATVPSLAGAARSLHVAWENGKPGPKFSDSWLKV